MDKINKIFFINLDRRVERRNHFEEQCIKHKIPLDKVLRMPAIDGTHYQFSENELLLFRNAKYLRDVKCCKKIMGNQMSHY